MFDIRNSFQFVLSTCIILSWIACLPVPSQKMKFTKTDSCWVLNCALINLRFMSLASTFNLNDTQRWTRMIQWGNQFFSRCFDVFQSPVPCNQQYAMSYCEGEGFWLIFPSWNSDHWPLCGESLGLVSRFFPFLSSLPSADPGHTKT